MRPQKLGYGRSPSTSQERAISLKGGLGGHQRAEVIDLLPRWLGLAQDTAAGKAQTR